MFDLINDVLDIIKNNEIIIDYDLPKKYLGENEDIFKTLVNAYLGNYQNFSDDILKLVESKNYQELELLVHKYKGMCLYLGVKIVFDFANYLVNELRFKNMQLDSELILFSKLTQIIYNKYKELNL